MKNLILSSFNHRCFVFIIIFVIIGIMILPSTVSATEKQVNTEYFVGDVNRDGNVDSLDFGNLRSYLLGLEKFEGIGQRLWEADVNGDGLVNALDFAYFRMWLLEGREFPKVSNRINTVITTVEAEPLDLIARAPNAILEFSVILRDEAGNPLGGKKVYCDNPGSLYPIKNPTETDENGCATFSFRQAHSDRVPFRTYEVDIGIYFDGDKEYKSSEYIAKAMISNNGGPTPTPTAKPTSTL